MTGTGTSEGMEMGPSDQGTTGLDGTDGANNGLATTLPPAGPGLLPLDPAPVTPEAATRAATGDCGFGPWESWTACSVTCQLGVKVWPPSHTSAPRGHMAQVRVRYCAINGAVDKSSDCCATSRLDVQEVASCDEGQCPPVWASWGPWSRCPSCALDGQPPMQCPCFPRPPPMGELKVGGFGRLRFRVCSSSAADRTCPEEEPTFTETQECTDPVPPCA